MEVTELVVEAMLAHAARTAPEECCGLLLGPPGRIVRALPAANVHADRARAFEIDPAALIAAHRAARDGGPALLGYYHSHPAGHPLPSATDCEHASGDGRAWAIVAQGRVTFWRDAAEGFVPLPTATVDG